MKLTVGAALLSVLGSAAWAGAPQEWPFDIVTTGEAVSWTSPTPVATGAPAYEASYTLSQVLVNVRFSIFNLGPIDVTDQIPAEQLSNSGQVPGPAPTVFFNDMVVYPLPPEAPAIAATLVLQLDASGFGKLDLNNVFLGTLQVDLGAPFGVQTVTLTRVQAIGTVRVDPIACPADLDGDGFVGSSDLASLLGGWNGSGPADLNGDGVVNSGDLAALLGAWGPCGS